MAEGGNEQYADYMGRCLVDADLRGVHSHGTHYVVTYIRNLQKGAWNPTPNITVVRDHHATAVIDADKAAGHLAGRRGMQLAIEKAKQYGTATVSVRNSNHCGALAYYTQMAADAGCIGFASTTAGRLMAPFGGVEKIIALNPLSWAAPTDKAWAVDLAEVLETLGGGCVGVRRGVHELGAGTEGAVQGVRAERAGVQRARDELPERREVPDRGGTQIGSPTAGG